MLVAQIVKVAVFRYQSNGHRGKAQIHWNCPICLFLPDSLVLATISKGMRIKTNFCIGQLKLLSTLLFNSNKHSDIFREVGLFLFLEVNSVLSKQAEPVVSLV